MFSVGINELQSLANASGGKKASHLQARPQCAVSFNLLWHDFIQYDIYMCVCVFYWLSLIQDVINADGLKRLTEYVGLLQQLSKGAFDDITEANSSAVPFSGTLLVFALCDLNTSHELSIFLCFSIIRLPPPSCFCFVCLFVYSFIRRKALQPESSSRVLWISLSEPHDLCWQHHNDKQALVPQPLVCRGRQ